MTLRSFHILSKKNWQNMKLGQKWSHRQLIRVITINPMFSNRTQIFGNVSHSIFISPSLLLWPSRRVIHSLLPLFVLVFTFWKKTVSKVNCFSQVKVKAVAGQVQGQDGNNDVLSKIQSIDFLLTSDGDLIFGRRSMCPTLSRKRERRATTARALCVR